MESLMYNEHWLKEIAQFDDKAVDKFLHDGNQYRLAQQLLAFFKNYLLIPDFERELYYLPEDQLNLTNVNKLWAEKVDDQFHARFSAKKRYYKYRIINRRAPLVLEKDKAWASVAVREDVVATTGGLAETPGEPE